jgi:hypothetical protein
MMFEAQVNWTGPLDATAQQAAPTNFASAHDSEAAFALVYEAILGLSDEQCSQPELSDNWLGTDPDGGLLVKYDSGRINAAINLGSGTGEHRSSGLDRYSELNLGQVEVRYSGSSMERLASPGKVVQVQPVSSPDGTLQPLTADKKAANGGNSGQSIVTDNSIPPPSSSIGTLNKSQLSDWMDAHALSRSSHHCAMYCRLGMEAAGLDTADRPRSGDAGDYGPFLLRHGAKAVAQDSYVPQVGDVAVFDKTGKHPYGHIEMYDGHQWVSDFMQHGFSPYRDAASTPPFTIYRLG